MEEETNPKKQKGHTCPWWLLFTFDNPIRKLVHDPKKILAPYIKSGDIALDVGCGMGFFSLEMAKLVGQNGKVITADLQEQMLMGLQKRAERASLMERIQLHLTTPDQIGVAEPVDFALAFWMVHEVNPPETFLDQIYGLLKPGGKFLLVEPIIHVSDSSFKQTVSLAQAAGFRSAAQPDVRLSRSVLFQK